MTAHGLPWYGASEIAALVGYRDAVEALRDALRAGLDPGHDPDRDVLSMTNGQLLLMPTESAGFAGVKIASVAPGNPGRGLPRIQGVYLLMDAATLTPCALFDGSALTSLRTPAVSVLAIDLLAPATVEHLVVFGTGPQARGHIDAMLTTRSIVRVSVIGRDPDRTDAFVADAARSHDGLEVRAASASAVSDAQLVVCATGAREPLFDGTLVPDEVCVVAVGSHEPTAREVDEHLVARSQVAVEDVATALREAGDVAMPVASGALRAESLVSLAQLARDRATVDRFRPHLFKSVGMAWEDLVVAATVYSAGRRQTSE